MTHYMLDTSICVELIRHRPGHLVRAVDEHRDQVGISAITLAELEYGAAKSRDPARNRMGLLHFLAPLSILPFDEAASLSYGLVRAFLEKSGTPIGPLDTLIASHAAAVDAVLVTANEREFDRVPGLRVENWARRLSC